VWPLQGQRVRIVPKGDLYHVVVGDQVLASVDPVSEVPGQLARRRYLHKVCFFFINMLDFISDLILILNKNSQDCPIFYMRKKVQKDLQDQDKLINRFGNLNW
jgi:hypothetical protein